MFHDQAVDIVSPARQPRHDIQPPRLVIIPQRVKGIVLSLQPDPCTLRDLVPGTVNEPRPSQLRLHLRFICPVKDRRDGTKTQAVNGPPQMGLQDLADVHPPGHPERIQYHVNRRTVSEERHVLNRDYLGDDTLVPVTARHLVALIDLS